jgi:hypothetical protein
MDESIYNYGMARLPTGTPATPAKVRQANYREKREAAGGHRLIADIEKDATVALGKLVKVHGTQKAAVTVALIEAARALP